ncbi:hypothetical protein ACSBR1_037552 [Camellia fascicularis]
MSELEEEPKCHEVAHNFGHSSNKESNGAMVKRVMDQRNLNFLWVHFDRFLSRRAIDSDKWWAMQLLSAACLSLATKMEEYRVPSPSEFQLECNFDSKVIQRMELLVLNALEWRMSSVTHFAFIHHFIRTLGNHHSPPRNVVSRTVHLILAIMRGKF